MDRLDLNLLVSLDVLLRERHVTRAAGQLGISQPAMSAQLARLRTIFGDPLLVPSGKVLIPTPRAEELARDLGPRLAELTGLLSRRAAFDPATATARFVVAASDAILHVFAVALVAAVRRESPGSQIALVRREADTVGADGTGGKATLALGATINMHPTWRLQRVARESFITVMRADHPLADGPLTLEAFCAAEHVLTSPTGALFTGVADRFLAERGLSRRVAVSVQDFTLVPALLAESDLLATLPRRFAMTLEGRLALRPPPLELPRFEVVMGWHPRLDSDPEQRWLRGLVQRVCEEVARAEPEAVAR